MSNSYSGISIKIYCKTTRVVITAEEDLRRYMLSSLQDEVVLDIDVLEKLWRARARIHIADTIVCEFGRAESLSRNLQALRTFPSPLRHLVLQISLASCSHGSSPQGGQGVPTSHLLSSVSVSTPSGTAMSLPTSSTRSATASGQTTSLPRGSQARSEPR